MTYYDDIYEIAVDHYYLISTDEAVEAGIPTVELAKLAHRGKLENISRGLYRLARYVPHANDPYAEAVARVGGDAYLHGESVISLLDLAPTNPARIYVATPKRTRKKLPKHISLKQSGADDVVVSYEGIRMQDVPTAIKAASSTMMGDRLHAAALEACRKGLLLKEDYDRLKREMGWE